MCNFDYRPMIDKVSYIIDAYWSGESFLGI